MKEKIKAALRWIAVPFAAVAAEFAVNIIGQIWIWVNGNGVEHYTGGTSTIDIVTVILLQILNFYVGYAFVYAGSYVAPSHQKNVSIVLATMQVCFCVAMSILMLSGYANNSLSSWAAEIITPIGSIYAAIKYPNKDLL